MTSVVIKVSLYSHIAVGRVASKGEVQGRFYFPTLTNPSLDVSGHFTHLTCLFMM